MPRTPSPVRGSATTTRLPSPSLKGSVSFEEALCRRRSIRRYDDRPLSMEQVSQLLWAAQGITDSGNGLRTAPSAGAVYPLSLYAATPGGVFRYIPETHSLKRIDDADLRPELAGAAFGQSFIVSAGITLIITAHYGALKEHYGEHGTRYTDMEAGHAAQNIHLQAAAMGLGSVPVAAFTAKTVKGLLRLETKEEPIYLIPVGYIK